MFYFERNVLTTMLFSEYIRLLHRRLPLVQLSYQEIVMQRVKSPAGLFGSLIDAAA